MIRDSVNDSGSGSESESNKGSRSPSSNRSEGEASQGGARSRSRSVSRTPSHSPSRSRSNSHVRTPSHSPTRSRSNSHARTPSHSPSRSRSNSHASATSRSKSRSRSPSQRSAKSKTHSRSPSQHSAHSKSPSQLSAHSKSPPQHSAHSKSRSRSVSAHSAHSKSTSRSVSQHSTHSKSRSRSASAHSESGSDVGGEKRKRQVLSDSGSDAEKALPKKKKSALIDSDSEPDDNAGQPEEEDVDATELFGDADDISTDEETRGKRKSRSSSEDDVRRGSDHDDGRRNSASDDNRRMSDDENTQRQKEKEPEPEPIPERRIDVEIPRIVSDLGKEIHFVKLPNFLSVETRPFDRDTYEDEIDEEETLDEEGRQRIKLKVSNTIRWREHFDDDGNVKRESNARMVRWDDGSISLHLGNEIFDVYKQPLQGDFNHLFIRQGTGLQGQAVFRTKLTFRPYSTESFTHKKMTMSLADRSQKTAGIKILTTVGSDPDANRYVKLKKEEEQLRLAMRQKTMQSKPKRNRDTAAGHSAGYREEHDSDDDGAISIAAIKNKYTGKGGAHTSKQGAAIYSSDEDESDFETRRSKKTDKAKVLRAIADSDDESGGSNRNAGSGNDSNANESKSGSDSD